MIGKAYRCVANSDGCGMEQKRQEGIKAKLESQCL